MNQKTAVQINLLIAQALSAICALVLLSVAPGGLWAAVSFNPVEGTGSIARGDIAGNPSLNIGGLVARPTVTYTDLVSYSQVCLKGGVSRIVSVAMPRVRQVKAEPQADNKPPTFQTITAYVLTGYWTVVLQGVPKDLCSPIEPGLVPEGPMTEGEASGGRLTFNCHSAAGDVVIWTAPAYLYPASRVQLPIVQNAGEAHTQDSSQSWTGSKEIK